MYLHVLKLEIGNTETKRINEKEVTFYKWLGAKVIPTEPENILYKENWSIPITNSEIESGGTGIYPLIEENFRYINSFAENDILIIDVDVLETANLRARVLSNIFTSLAAQPKMQDIENELICIFILEDLPPKKDTVWDGIKLLDHRTDIKVYIFDEIGQSTVEIGVDKNIYRKKRILSKHDPTVTIDQKMIKQLGHFQKDKANRKVCLRHFYDGTYCIKTISDYLWLELHEEISENSIILCHSIRSPWLEASVLSSDLDCKIVNLRNDPEFNNGDEIFIILDFIDTGGTILKYIESKKINPSKIIAILATNNSNEKNNERKFYDSSGKPIVVKYIIEADYNEIGNKPCQLCEIGIPHDSLPTLNFTGKLRSIDFWQMVTDTGLAFEKDPPNYRAPISKGVDTKKIFRENGGFISLRIQQICDTLQLSNDSSIIYPEGEESSDELAINLGMFLLLDAVSVPRKVINEFINGEYSLSLDDKKSDWYRKLSRSSIDKCIIIDDISITGGTLLGLYNLLQHMEKNVLAIIPFLHLSKTPEAIEGLVTPLYEWDN
jgi:adenine/guanine phosphoribosyltransferase-like PRPP-binding protein